jgi:hypothetical protein
MQASTNHSAKVRARSVQLEKGIDFVTGGRVKVELTRDLSTPPVPTARSSSLPSGKENDGSIRHYRSMLDVEGPPKLGPVRTFTYDELYVEKAKHPVSPRPQLPFSPGICTNLACWFSFTVCTG